MALSGGVDSAVTALLLQKAIGSKLHCVFVDHGLLPLNQRAIIDTQFRGQYQLNLTIINAQKQFFQALKGQTDPERKRKIIGQTFIQVFEQYQKNHPEIGFFAQGTIYSDVIESACANQKQKVIKSHHNVGGLPSKLKWPLIEPLRTLFKNEVRKIGIKLQLDPKIINSPPFPGPGLAIRIIGEVTAKRCAILQQADAIFTNELASYQLNQQISQVAVILLPVKSVGVVGDNRVYGDVCVLRAVQSNDFMTATVVNLDYLFLQKVAAKIINQIPAITRVLYDLTTKPPGTIEWE